MRRFLAALTLGATIAVAAGTAFASDKVDPAYYERVRTERSVSAMATSEPKPVYLEQRQDNAEH
jgi:hypothetical protein